MALVATLLTDPLRLARLTAGLRDRYSLIGATTWEQLFNLCRERAVPIAVVDPLVPTTPDGIADPLRLLRRQFPSLALVAYVSVPPVSWMDLFEYGRLNLDGVLVAQSNDEPRSLRQLIEKSESRGMLEPLRLRMLGESPTIRDAVLMSVSRASERLSPDSMARKLGIRRTALALQLARAGYPSPKQLIAWGRLLVASRLLEDGSRSVNNVAAALDFSSGSAFRNACQSLLSATPLEVRERGGHAYAVQTFLQHVKRAPSAAPAEA